MKTGLVMALCLPLAACSVYIDSDAKGGEGGNLHVSIGSLGGVAGNGKSVTQTRPVGLVNLVELAGAVDVDIRLAAGTTPSLTVQADENLQALIETVQTGDKLLIRTKRSMSGRNPIKVTLLLPALSRASNGGSGDMRIDGLDAERFELAVNGPGSLVLAGKARTLQASVGGSGDLQVDQLDTAALEINLSGPGDAVLKGHIAHVAANVSGSGDLVLVGVDGPADMRLNGPGSASLKGRIAALKARLSGSGDLDVTGLSGGNVDVEGHGPGNIQLVGNAGQLKLALSGSGDFGAEGLTVSDVEAELSGPGSASLGQVQADHFSARLSGSGDLMAGGKARRLDLAVTGPGSAALSRLAVQEADLRSSGSGDIVAEVSNSLHASSSGPGEIMVHGNPPVRDVQGRNVEVQG